MNPSDKHLLLLLFCTIFNLINSKQDHDHSCRLESFRTYLNNQQHSVAKLPRYCPKITYVQDVNVTQIPKAYYQIYTTETLNRHVCDGDCVTANVFRFTNSSARISICCKSGCGYSCGRNIGSGFLTNNAKRPEIIDYSVGNKTTPLYILATDKFNSYWVAYSCSSSKVGRKEEIVFVFSTHPSISEQLKCHIFKVLTSNRVDVSRISEVKQYSTCSYSYSFF